MWCIRYYVQMIEKKRKEKRGIRERAKEYLNCLRD